MPSVEGIVDDLRCSVEAVLTVLKKNSSAPHPSTTKTADFRAMLDESSKLVSAGATRLAVSFSSRPNVQEAKPLSESWYTSILALCDLYNQIPRTTGTALRELYTSAIMSIVESCLTFLQSLQQGLRDSNTNAHLSPAGVVWAQCDALLALPRGNGAATGQRMKQSEDLVNDAVTELHEEVSSEKGEDQDDEDADEEEEDEEEWSKAELEVVPAVLGLCRASCKALQKTRTQVLALYEDDNPEHVAHMDRLAELAPVVSEQVDDVVAAVYPPQVGSALLAAARALAQTVEDLLMLARAQAEDSGEGDSEVQKTLDFLAMAVTHNLTKLDSKLSLPDR